MQITRLSTKGQIVIPEELRQGLVVGTAFEVRRRKDLIVLKTLKGLTDKEQCEMEDLEQIWRDIDQGKGVTMTVEEFRNEMASW